MKSQAPSDEGDGLAPPKLVAAFKGLANRRVFVPPTLDEAILKTARRHLSPAAATRWHGLRRWLLWPGVATASAAVVLLVYAITSQLRTASSPRSFAREDVNQDGRVDILDAYQVARQIEKGDQLPASLDLNADGVVNRRDAESVAARAVRLEKGGRS